jgi:hypothetical protein
MAQVRNRNIYNKTWLMTKSQNNLYDENNGAVICWSKGTRYESLQRQTVVAFLDINEAYNNVLIDVLCGVMLEKMLPLGIARFMTV